MRRNLLFLSVALVSPVVAACLTFPESSYDDEPRPDMNVDERFEVVVYDSWEFTGHRRASWILEPGMRQKLVEFVGWNVNDRISSIRVGYMVGVAMFKHRDFRGPAKIYYGSQGRLDMSVNDEFSSLIVFHKDIGEPLGVWMGATLLTPSRLDNWDLPEDTWFFPLPEDAGETVIEYRGVGDANDRPSWVMVSPVTDSPAPVSVEVTLFEHDQMRGESITLPGFRSSDYYFDLKEFDFEGKLSSLVIRERQGADRFRTRRRYPF